MNLINYVDKYILQLIKTYLFNPFFDYIMPLITMLGDNGLIWIIIALGLLIIKKYRKIGIMILVAITISFIICSVILKPMFNRPRPNEHLENIELLIKPPTDFSFPSGHTSVSIAGAFIIFYANKKMGILAYILAGLIAFSRMYLFVHYPSDILGGIIIGIISGVLAIKIINSLKKGENYEKI
ncbi:MAG: phosphatase PAP2 family protein [Bacilli bacterium]